MIRTLVLAVTAVALWLSATQVPAATVAINPATTYQTMEGIGGFGPAKVWWDSPPFYTASWVNQVVNDLGMSMTRTAVSASFEYANDNADPNSFNRATCNISGHVTGEAEGPLGDHFPFYRAMKAAHEANGESFKLIASVWTPPAWMKTNSDIRNGGNLRTDMYSEFAERCLEYCRVLRDSTGVSLYGLSIQNEPAFVEPYESCVYNAATYRDLLKVVGPRVHAEFPNLKFFGAEHMLTSWGTFEGTLSADTAARSQIGAYAVHGYTDGVTPQPSSTAAVLWRAAWRNASGAAKPLWMTETSGFSADWAGAMENALCIFAGLKYGNISAWTLWYTCDNMYSSGNPDKRYYIHKQFSRYIRPGAVGISSSSDDSTVLVVAFRHPTQSTLSIVLFNTSAAQRSVTLSGANLPSFAAYRSSASENCASVGTVTGSLNLPASSITTLYGTNYVTGVVERPAARPASIGRVARAARTYGLDGRLLVSTSQAAGLSVVRLQSTARCALSLAD
jgi:glucuronoarabinoxylan endo-1,4-beta-xylanase